MSEFIDDRGLTFARFIESGVISTCITRDSISFVNPQKMFRVVLVSKVKIPGKEYLQCFDEHYLLPIAKELRISLALTAKLMAIRKAWIAYFQESGISKTVVNEMKLQIANDIATDYIVLTSANWSEHPWIAARSWMYPEEGKDHVSLAEAWNYHQWQESIGAQEEGEINSCINDFRNQKQTKAYTSLLDKNADYAEHDIKLAKKKIQELQAEVVIQKAIIREATKPIRKFQNSERTLDKKAPGRPIIAEQQQRRDIAMKFVEQWIGSLMSTLSITSCGELAKIIGGQKMNWWRWLNKETLPSSSSLESLLNIKIKSGEHQSKKLPDLQTTPSLADLIILVDLV